MSDKSISYDYIFGFGSIMDTSTHATWQTTNSPSITMPGSVVTLSKRFGYQRQWNFRSTTGFTALGVSKASREGESCDINGVLFQVPRDEMPNFDRRESGYDRVGIPLEMLKFHPEISGRHSQVLFQLNDSDRVWIYIPHACHTMYADENHPLLQSYVDTVLRGCLDWGGEAMAEQFIQSTGGWGTYFLNDTPNSRRPWLYRKEYNTIDALLKKYSNKTHYGDRRHPEEFAASFNQRMRGTWSIPRRNPNFTGRDVELTQLHSQFTSQDLGRRAVVTVTVAGMGGIGKTQLVTEYCYRYFPTEYGLVVWVNAETSDSLITDYRQLLADLASDNSESKMNIVNMNKSSDDIICEVKTRLFRSQVPWLLVLDNLEDRTLFEKFVPHGAGARGHVLITTRHVDLESNSEHLSGLLLGCFSTNESLELLRRSVGHQNPFSAEDETAATELANQLGNLPLALSVAGAYMRRCDVGICEYLARYSDQTFLDARLNDYAMSVASSLSLSLKEVQRVSPIACDVLKLLSFLGPDQITKLLIRNLLRARAKKLICDTELNERSISAKKRVAYLSCLFCTVVVAGAFVICSRKSGIRVAMLAIASTSAAAILSLPGNVNGSNNHDDIDTTSVKRISSETFSSSEYEQSDIAWNVLKSFSLITVKEGKGNVHRLLQQAMRSCQTQAESTHNITICLDAIASMWTFDTAETSSWKDSLPILEHIKSVVSHCMVHTLDTAHTMHAAHLSKDTAIFSAMALNAFSDAKVALDYSLRLYESKMLVKTSRELQKAKAETLLELGRIFRYQGMYLDSKESLNEALIIFRRLNKRTSKVRKGIADTLHEMGLLELKQHSLNDAELHLMESLELRRKSQNMNSECAATLHQLAAVHLSRKDLDKAKSLLLEALSLCSQIGQRAATLKQLARVTIRQGLLDIAETYLDKALELYLELYADNKQHMNIAAVQFQRGALSSQRERFDDAWLHFMECLRIRRHVYSYARSAKDKNPTHLEVSCVLHELGCVGFALGRYSQSKEMFSSEREILMKLEEGLISGDRIHQARLTNLTWLKKCAKELGEEGEISRLSNERAMVKKNLHNKSRDHDRQLSIPNKLEQDLIQCRVLARKFALDESTECSCKELKIGLDRLGLEVTNSQDEEMKRVSLRFQKEILEQIQSQSKGKDKVLVLQACDTLRNVLRSRGVKVHDTFLTLKP